MNILDSAAQAVVLARVNRMKLGLLGDTKAIQDGLFEMRIFYGPGYRVYFAISGQQVVVLFCGGDKSSQKSDIKFARKYWKDWRATK